MASSWNWKLARNWALIKSIQSFLLLLQLILVISSYGRHFANSTSTSTFQNVTCGSMFKLMNVAYKIRLHSHDVKYGSGSGQQSVTGSETNEDVESNWIVKGVSTKLPCVRGEPILCGTKIRLEHVATSKNLHSHLFTSPLSDDQEISAYGIDGEGDSGDIWEVKCPHGSSIWKRDELIQLKHQDTGVWLSASGNTYGRPIHGQMEISGISSAIDVTTFWQTMEGAFIHADTNFNKNSHRFSSSNNMGKSNSHAKVEL